jgi:hypothetical protein
MEVLVYDSLRRTALAEIDVGVFGFGAVRQISGVTLPAETVVVEATPVAGGRYLVWVNQGKYPYDPRWTSIFDRRTRTVTTLPGGGGPLVGDPFRPRVFFQTSYDTISVFDFRTGVQRVAARATGELRAIAYAGRADRLVFVQFRNEGTQSIREIQVVDVSTATTLASFPAPASTFDLGSLLPSLRVTQDGTLAYVADGGAGSAVVAYDTAQGIEVARSVGGSAGLVLDDDRELVLIQRTPGHATVLHPRTLATMAVLPVATSDELFRVIPGQVATGAFVIRTNHGNAGGCAYVDLDTLNVLGQRRATLRLSTALGDRQPNCSAPVTVAVIFRAPPTPTELNAQVVGNMVSISWQNPNTLEFELAVGLAPGVTTLLIPVGDPTTVSFAGVPPGTYYVRVRARNEVGSSAFSAEMRIDVP